MFDVLLGVPRCVRKCDRGNVGSKLAKIAWRTLWTAPQIHYYSEAVLTQQHGYCRSLTPKRHRQLRAMTLPKIPTWRQERKSNPRPFGRASQFAIFTSHKKWMDEEIGRQTAPSVAFHDTSQPFHLEKAHCSWVTQPLWIEDTQDILDQRDLPGTNL